MTDNPRSFERPLNLMGLSMQGFWLDQLKKDTNLSAYYLKETTKKNNNNSVLILKNEGVTLSKLNI